MDSFADQFDLYLQRDRASKNLFDSVIGRGFVRSRIVVILQVVSDPDFKMRMQEKHLQSSHVMLFPPGTLPKKMTIRKLASKLEKVALKLRSMFADSVLVCSADAQAFQKMAADLQRGAYALRQIRMSSVSKLFSYKRFTKHIPIAMLCRALNVPKSVKFKEIDELLWIAARARGLNHQPADRTVEMQFKRLMKRPIGRQVDLLVNILLEALPRD